MSSTMRGMEPGKASNAVTQLRRGTLEYCVLALLRESQQYAYELVRSLAAIDGMVTSEGTIYPLLSRLRNEQLVETFWQESESGPPRRYYQLTQAGSDALAVFTTDWARFRDAVDSLLLPGADNGNRH